MTAISNVFCDEFIACGSDSFLTKRTSAGVEHVETERKKIFPLQGLPGAISYWGFAGLESLNIADELEALAKRAHAAASLESFAYGVRDHFNALFGKYPGIPKSERGLGMHLAGYEIVEGFRIPELFLMTNFNPHSPDRFEKPLPIRRGFAIMDKKNRAHHVRKT